MEPHVRKVTAGVVSLVLAVGAGAVMELSPASAAPRTSAPSGAEPSMSADQLPHPLDDKRTALRRAALEDILSGRAKPVNKNGSTVVRLAGPLTATPAGRAGTSGTQARRRAQYVELAREKTDRIFVVLAEFGNERHPDYPDQDTDPRTPGPTVFDGPLRNKIPEPDRSTDNTTVWQSDYDRAHYQKLYFGKGEQSVQSYYKKQSSGRYSVDGTVTDWVKVRYNEARYGRSNGYPCASIVCTNTWELIKDAVDQWVVDQKAAGRTRAQITAELKTFDQWDRYDADADGNFNEPDGYLDHFQIVHAGGDQADGDPQQGEDAIWSHRWYAYFDKRGQAGPAGNLLGGTQVAGTGLWIGDYTIQPENGGLSVFAHEYGHDLGLPDHYDTTGGDNGVEYWTLMAQSRLNAPGEALGTRPGDLGAWDKLQLGWLDYEVVPAGTSRTLELGPHEYNSRKPQAVVVPLPPKQVTTQLGAPAAGDYQWYSGQGDELASILSRQVTLGAGSSTLSLQARWNIEDCGPDPCDYAYVEVDDGTGWQSVAGSITQASEGNGIDGTRTSYTSATFDLSAYAGETVQLRLRYATDGATQGNDPTVPWSGIFIDEVTLTSGGTQVFTDGAESAMSGWAATGFARVQASATDEYGHYYLASNRSYVSYDRWLRSGPYNLGFLPDKPDLVEHFSYEPGLLVTYWDSSQSDNNTSQHPGEGLILPVDSRPAVNYRIDGRPWRSRMQVYDAPFSLRPSKDLPLHYLGQPSYIRGDAAQPVFDDRLSYWDPATPASSVKVPNAGVRMEILKQRGTSMTVQISSTR
ncbi:MAG: immune inhibitor A domain-containing protein [Angustibacter sp.]